MEQRTSSHPPVLTALAEDLQQHFPALEPQNAIEEQSEQARQSYHYIFCVCYFFF